MKKICLSVTALLMVLVLCACMKSDSDIEKDLLQMEYSTDAEFLNSALRFPPFESCFYKRWEDRASFRGHDITYGFIVLSRADADAIYQQYDWQDADITFPAGIDPAVTGAENTTWLSSADYTANFNFFHAEAHFTPQSGVVYFIIGRG